MDGLDTNGSSTNDIDSRFVTPAQFTELLTSRRNLERADDRSKQIRGLIDHAINVRFVVRENELNK